MVAGFWALLFSVAHSLMPDPTSVYIDQLGRDIDPRSYIATQCPNSVGKVGHLDTRSFSGDDKFERWDVTPLPGHVDVVLLNMTTGVVICP